MPTPILQVEQLTLTTRQGTVVTNLSFQINEGEIIALTGKSGSGKTSVAMAILDLLPPGLTLTEGAIHWFHEKNSLALPGDFKLWASLRGTSIAFVQQDVFGAFDPVLPMGRQMLMVINERTKHPHPDLNQALRIKMEEVGLHDIDRLLNSYPHQLSGGQLQRCQLAMTIVIQPALLIADEPTSAIDKINQLELLDVFAMLSDKYKMAILCITHEVDVVRYLADREVRLEEITNDHTHTKPKDHSSVRETDKPVLIVTELEYAHAYGGMLNRKGAMVGKIDLKLFKGSCFGVVGESGSGKSTLAQLLVGLFKPKGGTLTVEGKTIDFNRSADLVFLRSKIQLVMQDGRGSLHPHFTIQQILQEIVELRQLIEPDFVCNLIDSLAEVDLPPGVLDRTPGTLSGGECLRVSIARALVIGPEILICDESTSALDGETRDSIVNLLLHLMSTRGLAILFISHDEWIIRSIADEILVLSEGKIVEQGPAQAILQHPTHPVTRKIFSMHATFAQKGRL